MVEEEQAGWVVQHRLVGCLEALAGRLPVALRVGSGGYCPPSQCCSVGLRSSEPLLGLQEAAQASQLKKRYQTLYTRILF